MKNSDLQGEAVKIRLFKKSSTKLLHQARKVAKRYWKVERALSEVLGQRDSAMPLTCDFKASDLLKWANAVGNKALYVLPKFGPDCMVAVVAASTEDLDEKLTRVLEHARAHHREWEE